MDCQESGVELSGQVSVPSRLLHSHALFRSISQGYLDRFIYICICIRNPSHKGTFTHSKITLRHIHTSGHIQTHLDISRDIQTHLNTFRQIHNNSDKSKHNHTYPNTF